MDTQNNFKRMMDYEKLRLELELTRPDMINLRNIKEVNVDDEVYMNKLEEWMRAPSDEYTIDQSIRMIKHLMKAVELYSKQETYSSVGPDDLDIVNIAREAIKACEREIS